MTVGEWRRHLKGAEVVAVLSLAHEHLLGALVTQLGEGSLISAVRPVGEALKLVVDGLIVESVDRNGVVQLVEPYAFAAELGQSLIDLLDDDTSIDLLPMLARATTPLSFQFPAGDS
ncbi:MAG: hypothetical protein ACR2NT_08110 [Acidimicrobiia bacterium]